MTVYLIFNSILLLGLTTLTFSISTTTTSSKGLGFKSKNDVSCRRFNSYKIRIANVNDIPFISDINIKNLSENYWDEFYIDQLKKWPNLSLLCEDSDKNIVGYALGRVLFKERKRDASVISSVAQPLLVKKQVFYSMAVSPEHRGKRIAKEFVDFMHIQFASTYDLDSVHLHCRVST